MQRISNSTKVKQIMIIGNYGNFNIGDELLLKSLVFQYINKFKEGNVRFFVPTRHPEFIHVYHEEIKNKLISFKVLDLKKLLLFLLKSDEILIGGGGMWSAYTGKLAKLLPLFMVIAGSLKPLFVKGIGLYNTASKMEKIFVNLAFLFAKSIEVRDEESFHNVWKIVKKSRPVKLVDDLSLNIPILIKNKVNIYKSELYRLKETEKLRNAKKIGKKIIGISIKPLKSDFINKKIVQEFVFFIKEINKKYPKHFYFTFFPFAYTSPIEDDITIINLVLSKLKESNNLILIPHTNPIFWHLLIEEYIDYFIGMRFHAIALAYLSAKPLLGIPYENKVLQFLKRYKYQNIVMPEDLNRKTLVDFLERAANIKL